MSEKKYKTKPIDYTGCHPVIADHLKRGLAIECRVKREFHEWEEDAEYINAFLAYHHGESYQSDKDFSDYFMAEPIEIKTVLRKKKASEIVKWMEDRGYEFDGKFWVGSDCNARIYSSNIFSNYGKVISAPRHWEPAEWYEEAEE